MPDRISDARTHAGRCNVHHNLPAWASSGWDAAGVPETVRGQSVPSPKIVADKEDPETHGSGSLTVGSLRSTHHRVRPAARSWRLATACAGQLSGYRSVVIVRLLDFAVGTDFRWPYQTFFAIYSCLQLGQGARYGSKVVYACNWLCMLDRSEARSTR
jgi:hypothetical protein